MEEMDWNSLKIEIEEYLEADTLLDGGLRQIVELHLQVGTDEGRGNLWDSIRAMVKNIEGLQLRQGRRSSLPAEIMVNVNSVKQTVYTACATLIDTCAVILETFLPHGKTGGNYTKDTFFCGIILQIRLNPKIPLISAYRDKNGKRWDGTLDKKKNGMTGMVSTS